MDSESERLRQAVGERIRSLRNERGITQERLAAKAGVHRTYVGKLERAESGATIESIAVLCNALGVTLSKFFAPFRDRFEVTGPRRDSRLGKGS